MEKPYAEALRFRPEKDYPYDEDQAVAYYVWSYCTDLMTEFEQKVWYVIYARAKAEVDEYPNWESAILKVRRIELDAAIEEALIDGPIAFRRRVKDRLLREEADRLVINRCPRCQRVVRTPKARLCLWCGYDWHRADESSEAAPG